MRSSQLIIETINCLLDAGLIIFYLFLIMKKECRYPLKFLIVPAVGFFGIFVALTFTDVSPWIKLGIAVTMMMLTSFVMFESKIRSIIFYCLLFAVVLLVAEIAPAAILNIMNIGATEHNTSSGFGRYICRYSF